jgi:hypothetical protein
MSKEVNTWLVFVYNHPSSDTPEGTSSVVVQCKEDELHTAVEQRLGNLYKKDIVFYRELTSLELITYNEGTQYGALMESRNPRAVNM